ncbi:MAG: hypothetical protein KC729_18270, partial [Candidatus Eisenbacteria bacterium]|nr:hypothetical protein [Candidatus Eisenbacteria bacterium]
MRITQISRKTTLGFGSRPLLTLLCLTATVAFTPGCGSDNGTVSPPAGPPPYQPTIPVNFPDFREPEDNPTTVEGVALG